jgi:microcystin-dependent protein
MADYFLGEIRPFACNFAPYGWQLCQGQILPIQQYAALFSILGTYYGGNGTTNFQLPNIQGSVLIGTGQLPGGGDYIVGETGGETGISIGINTMPAHAHTFNGGLNTGALEKTSDTNIPVANVSFLSNIFAKPAGGGNQAGNLFTKTSVNTQMNPALLTTTGGNLPHANQQPYLVINYCIAINGEFPRRN